MLLGLWATPPVMKDDRPEGGGTAEFRLAGDIDVTNSSRIGDELCEFDVEAPHGGRGVHRRDVRRVALGLVMMACVQRFAEDAGRELTWREATAPTSTAPCT